MKEISYKLEGISPILFHNVNSMDLVKPRGMSHADFENSPEMFKARLYIEEDDKLTIPPRVIMGLLKEAAKKSGIKQDRKRSTYADLIDAVVFCLDPVKLNVKISDVGKHKEYVTVQRSKVLRVFPMLQKWKGTLNLVIDEKQIPLEALDEIFEYGSAYCGFGDYRPQFGRFKVNRF